MVAAYGSSWGLSRAATSSEWSSATNSPGTSPASTACARRCRSQASKSSRTSGVSPATGTALPLLGDFVQDLGVGQAAYCGAGKGVNEKLWCDLAVPQEVLGEQPLAGVLVVDRYSGYNREATGTSIPRAAVAV